ncbi:MAG: TetR family transcriptional regulator C-terminal domain-containing protein [Gilvibacter sp.]
MEATKTTAQDIIATYMDYVLEHEHEPKSIYKFCKHQNIQEPEFYAHFGSFDTLKQQVWQQFFTHTIQLLEKSKDYEASPAKEKMLSFYYTFFELLTANRSYVLFTLEDKKNIMKSLQELKGLRQHIKEFAKDLIEHNNENKSLKITKHPVSVFSEGAWVQTLFILKYWMEDSSPEFEKTDVVIEKSVRVVFDVFDTTPLESLIDFGKFLWKEKMA